MKGKKDLFQGVLMELENIRKLIDLLAVNQENLQKVINLDIQAITRGINILLLKKKLCINTYNKEQISKKRIS